MIAVERTETRPVAEVEPSDEYGVQLRVRRKREHYTADEAIILAAELVRVAELAKADLENDKRAWAEVVHAMPGSDLSPLPCCGREVEDLPKVDRLTTDPDAVTCGRATPSHRFDVAPICRECKEEKHGACTGIALVDGDDVEEHPCGCSRVDHEVVGGAA
ncbi:MAG: hypothetical protein K0R60_54 [Microbacterium sp.]|jgi:hypothetical protein|nr:hypothetical protein [Microbacterium sp.]